MKKCVLLTILLVNSLVSAHAQFVQKGSTMEYHGRNPRTFYKKAVSLNFKGAANTVNTDGRFELFFNQLTAGKLVNTFDISIADTSYVLFNKPILQRWILTKDLGMEVLLCRKSLIDKTKNEYIKSHEAIIKKKYDEKIKKLQKDVQDAEELNREVVSLNDSLMKEMEEMKEKAVFFAFVDESKLDSIHYQMRQYELKGEYDKAAELGRSIDYSRVSDNLIHNIDLSISKGTSYIDDLFNLQVYLEQQIVNIRRSSYRSRKVLQSFNYEDEIRKNYETLHKTYRYLIGLYTTQLRCEQDFLDDLKMRFAKTLYESLGYQKSPYYESLLKEATELGYLPAILVSAERAGSKEESLNYYTQALHLATDSAERDLIKEKLESFADFHDTSTGDTIYYHILSGEHNTVSVTDFHPLGGRNNLIIPSYVKKDGIKYTIVKLGYNCFKGNCNWSDNGVDHKEFERPAIHNIRIPNTITEISQSCFGSSLNVSQLVIPGSVKTIKSNAFDWCSIDSIIIAEGVENIEENAFNSIRCKKNRAYYEAKYIDEKDWHGQSTPELRSRLRAHRIENPVIYTDSIYSIKKKMPVISISLPSTLRNLSVNSFANCYHDKLSNVKVVLNKKCKNYLEIDGAIYDSDTTLVSSSLISSDTHVLYIGSKMNLKKYDVEDIDTMAINLDSIVVSPANSNYMSIDGIFWCKNSFNIWIPMRKNHITLYHNVLSDSVRRKYTNRAYRLREKSLNRLNRVVIPKQKPLEEKYIFDFLSSILYNQLSFYKNRMKDNYSPVVVDELSGREFYVKDYLLKIASDLSENVVYNWAGGLWSFKDSTYAYRRTMLPLELIKENHIISMDLLKRVRERGSEVSQKVDTMIYRQAEALYELCVLYSKKNQERSCFYADASKSCFEFCLNKNFKYGDCANYLGILYSSGLLPDGEELEKAYRYYCISTQDSLTWYAANNLGRCYYNGRGVEKNFIEAEQWFKKAFELGDSITSPFNLGSLYYEGLLTGKPDFDKAFYFFSIAAEKGNDNAMNGLAYLLMSEGYKKRNIGQAFDWIDKAIELRPEIPHYYDSKGEFFLMIRDTLNAKRMYNLALKKDPTFSNYNTVLFTKLGDIVEKDSIQSIFINTLLNRYRKSREALLDLQIVDAAICYTRPNWYWRLEHMTKILAIKDDAFVLNLLGLYYFYYYKNHQNALQWFLKAASKGYHPAYINVAFAYKKLGKQREADIWFKKAAINN